MKKYLPYIIVFIVGLLIGAILLAVIFTTTLSKFLRLEHMKDHAKLMDIAYKVYKTGDFDSSIVVLNELAKELELYHEAIKTDRSIAIDLGLTYARLFVLYERTGKQDLANEYYQKATELLISCGEKTVKSPEELKEFISKIDKYK